MRTQSIDTHPEIERVLIDMIRKAPMSKRFRSVQSLTQTLLWANIHAWQMSHQETNEHELVAHVLSDVCHPVLIQRVVDAVRMREGWQIQRVDLGALLFSTLHRLETLGIPSYLVGSIASSVYGMQQLAQDCDLVVHVDEQTIPSLKTFLKQDFVVDEEALQVAVQHRTAFSLIHLDSLMKIDVILPKRSAFDVAMLSLVAPYALDERYPPFQMVSAPEMILFKLQRYFHNEQSRTDGMNDDAEWNDILGMLKVQRTSLDLALLESWITSLHLDDPWQRVLVDAGLQDA